MSLRAQLSSTEVDRIILSHADSAIRSIREALKVAQAAEKSERGLARRRAKKTHRELARCLHQLETLSRVGNPYAVPDNDLIPDEDRPLPSWVEERAIERQQQIQAMKVVRAELAQAQALRDRGDE